MKFAIIKFKQLKNFAFNTYIYCSFTYCCYSVLYVLNPLTVTNARQVRTRKMKFVEYNLKISNNIMRWLTLVLYSPNAIGIKQC